MGLLLGYALPFLFLSLFASAHPCMTAVKPCHTAVHPCSTAVNEVECEGSRKSTLLIVFGDSFFDVGYGNSKLCLPSGNTPYGKSLDCQVAAGRFSDGLVVPDYIAKYLDLAPNGKVAAYQSDLNIQQALHGPGKGCASLSFAMAGARVMPSASKSTSLTDQVNDFLRNSSKFFVGNRAKFVGEQDQTLYLFSIGTYDYLAEVQNIKNEQDVQKVADNVTAEIVEQKIAEAQGVNGKRFAFMSVALRYMPVVQKFYQEMQPQHCCSKKKEMQPQQSQQFELIDKLETAHCDKLEEKLKKLAEEHENATTGQGHIINYSILRYHSIINAVMKEPEKYGYNKTTVTSACCGDGSYRADGCGHSDEKGCNDPTAYVFWDGMHNTQHINREIARIFWNGPTDMAFPQNLQTLAGTQKPRYDFSVNTNELFGFQSPTM